MRVRLYCALAMFVILAAAAATFVIAVQDAGAQGDAEPGQHPKETTYWPKESLEAASRELDPIAQDSERNFAAQRRLITPTHAVYTIHRNVTADAEQHVGVTDYWIVENGEGTLVVGGEIVDAREVGPGEYRGPAIKGGTEYELQPGDEVTIPPHVSHQVLVEDGKFITYTIVKVNIGHYPWQFLR